MAIEHCSSCRAPRNLRASVSRRKTLDPDGRTTTIRTTSFHCESCGQFVRSEEVAEPAPVAGSTVATGGILFPE